MLARVRELERQDREDAQRATLADLQRFVEEKRREYEDQVTHERANGNNTPRVPMLREAIFDGQRAIVRYGMNSEMGRMDIFYGGSTPNPMDRENGHGHVVVKHGTIEEWLLPGKPGKDRKRAI